MKSLLTGYVSNVVNFRIIQCIAAMKKINRSTPSSYNYQKH